MPVVGMCFRHYVVYGTVFWSKLRSPCFLLLQVWARKLGTSATLAVEGTHLDFGGHYAGSKRGVLTLPKAPEDHSSARIALAKGSRNHRLRTLLGFSKLTIGGTGEIWRRGGLGDWGTGGPSALKNQGGALGGLHLTSKSLGGV